MERSETEKEHSTDVERKSLDARSRRQLQSIAVIVLILTGLLIGLSVPSYFGELDV